MKSLTTTTTTTITTQEIYLCDYDRLGANVRCHHCGLRTKNIYGENCCKLNRKKTDWPDYCPFEACGAMSFRQAAMVLKEIQKNSMLKNLPPPEKALPTELMEIAIKVAIAGLQKLSLHETPIHAFRYEEND